MTLHPVLPPRIARTTRVRSRVHHLDGAAAPGRRVVARLLATPPWTADRTGQVLATATTWTDDTGTWTLDLLPYTVFREPDHVVVEIVESATDGNHPLVQYARIPPSDVPLWLGDLLVDPPIPPIPPWQPVKTLLDLLDVDRLSLETAKPGDYLQLLPSGKWGATHGPMGLTLVWSADPDDLLGVLVVVSGFGGRGARVDFGDDTPPVAVTSADPVRHVYADPGDYEVTATDTLYPAFIGVVHVVVKDHTPRAHLFVDSDDDWTCLLWLDEPADADLYQVEWGDDTEPETTRGQDLGRVPPRPRLAHPYGRQGRWTITVTDLATRRVTTADTDTGEIGVVILFEDSPYQPRAVALWMATGATWEIDAGVSVFRGIVPASGRLSILRPDPLPAGHYRFHLREFVEDPVVPRRESIRRVLIPNQHDWVLAVWFGWRRDQITPHHQDPPQTIRVQAKNARVDCLVTWDDGSPVEALPLGATAAHDYAMPVPTGGHLLRVEEDPALLPPGSEQRVFVRLIGAPRYIGTPLLNARNKGAVDLHIAGIDGELNSDWYEVSWGDPGTAVQDAAAIGAWFPATHTYRDPGTYTITVDAPGMPEPVKRHVTVVDYPSPTVRATEHTAAADPEHRTALIAVDNTASGGPATLDFGDGTPPVVVDEQIVLSHRFPPSQAGASNTTYWVTVASIADPTARGRVAVDIPYPVVPGHTLEFTVAPYGANPSAIELVVTAGNRDKVIFTDWGDGVAQNVAVTIPAHHTYTYPGAYTLTVGYSDASELTTRDITIPWPDPVRALPAGSPA